MSSFKKIQRVASMPVPVRAAKVDDGTYALPSISRAYLLGGKATFVVSNVETGEHMTFKVRRARKEFPKGSDKYEDAYFLNVKVPGQRFPFCYVGIMNPDTGTVKTTAQSVFLPGSKEYTTGAWATNVVMTGKTISSTYRIQHLGKCGKCGKLLGTTVDIELGLHAGINGAACR